MEEKKMLQLKVDKLTADLRNSRLVFGFFLVVIAIVQLIGFMFFR
jgi:hypothetical protein